MNTYGTLKCWGSGASGQLGKGNTNDLGDGAGEMGSNLTAISLGTGRTATAIATGRSHACAILDNSSLKCWGANNFGQLGQGSTNNLGDDALEMGDNLSAINLGAGRTATSICAHQDSACALLDNNEVKCWGNGSGGRLGQDSTNNIGDGPNEMGNNLSPINLGTGRAATSISCGRKMILNWEKSKRN